MSSRGSSMSLHVETYSRSHRYTTDPVRESFHAIGDRIPVTPAQYENANHYTTWPGLYFDWLGLKREIKFTRKGSEFCI